MLYVTGDIHGDLDRFSEAAMPGESRWTADDVLIVCGDFGFVWSDDPAEDDPALDFLAQKPYTILFVDGNHENHPRLASLPQETRFGAPVHVVRDHIFHLMRGQLYTVQGYSLLAMGGAASTDKEYRLLNQLPWWPQEMPLPADWAATRERLEQVDWAVDLVITHTAPREILYALGEHPYPPERPLTEFLDELWERLRFSGWYFGHWHRDCVVAEGVVACWQAVHALPSKATLPEALP